VRYTCPLMALEKIIVLDDELIIRKSLEAQLRKRKYIVACVGTIAEAEALLQKDSFDLIFMDVRLPDGDGVGLLERLSQLPSRPMAIMMTGYGTIESAVKCMQLGAFDYLLKPFGVEQIDICLKRAEENSQLVKLTQFYSQEVGTGGGQSEMELIGESQPMLQLKTMIKKVAATGATVMINGENGTGKELVAHEIWRQSPLAGNPYIKVNCAAISETLIESEFFGHERGAFTGATERREGRFELANNGTILLDEISEIPPRLQAKLLRVLQEREFERVGGNRTIQVNVRVLATTNRDLMKAVEKGDFREDLYYRLNVFPIPVPALRDRGDDIIRLAQSFLEKFQRKHGVKPTGFAKATLAAIKAHPWPGNVRELQNTIERAVILSETGRAIEPSLLGITAAIKKKPKAKVALV
jgi:two-component system, NtrC family, response regulator AtoC